MFDKAEGVIICDECGSSILPTSPLIISHNKHYCGTNCFNLAQSTRSQLCSGCRQRFFSGMKGVAENGEWFHSEKCRDAYRIAKEVHNAHPSSFEPTG